MMAQTEEMAVTRSPLHWLWLAALVATVLPQRHSAELPGGPWKLARASTL